MQNLDSAWIAANPPPVHGDGTNKNTRGHVIVLGGGRMVPGAPRLSAEAALRAGAGKVQVATIASAAMLLGVAIPEVGIFALPENDHGEITADGLGQLSSPLERCDTVVIGPGMGPKADAAACVHAIAAAADVAIILDAGAIAGARDLPSASGPHSRNLLLTPNYDEMARLLDRDVADIANAPEAAATEAARRFAATIILKGETTLIAPAVGEGLHYFGGGVGLATGGSGDVLAGAIAGVLSRGATALTAAGWGVWLQGQAARRLATDPGPIGFLARELPGEFPHLLPQ